MPERIGVPMASRCTCPLGSGPNACVGCICARCASAHGEPLRDTAS